MSTSIDQYKRFANSGGHIVIDGLPAGTWVYLQYAEYASSSILWGTVHPILGNVSISTNFHSKQEAIKTIKWFKRRYKDYYHISSYKEYNMQVALGIIPKIEFRPGYHSGFYLL